MKNKLSFVENAIHFSVWIFVAIYWLYSLYRAQHVFPSKYLSPGWRILGKLMDDNDVDWKSWKYYIRRTWPYMLIHCFTSEIIRRINISILKYWYIIFSVVFIINFMNVRCLAIFLVQPIIYFALIVFGGKRSNIWLTSTIILAVHNMIRYKYWYLWYNFVSKNSYEASFLGFTLCWIHIRCISFSLDYIEKEDKKFKLTKFNLIINMFSYILYQPLFIFGPIINYEVFEISFLGPKESLWFRFKRFSWDIMIFVTYSVVMEFLLHYIYSNAMYQRVDENISKLSIWELWAGGLWMSLHFHTKYVITYGTTSALSRLDHIDAPPTPRCIARIHLYSQMWKHFDVGFYRFFVKYIYIPTYNNISAHTTIPATCKKMLSSLTTFIFVFAWHGTNIEMFAWTGLNYLSLVIENTGRAIGKSTTYKRLKDKILKTNAMEIRFQALICTPLIVFNAIANFYLFAGFEIGNYYFSTLFKLSFCDLVLFYFVWYCYCHVSIALQDCAARTDVKGVKAN